MLEGPEVSTRVGSGAVFRYSWSRDESGRLRASRLLLQVEYFAQSGNREGLAVKFFSSVAAAVLALKPRSASAPPLFVSNDAAARRFAHRIKRGHVRRGQRGVIIRCAAGVPVGLHELDRCAERGGASGELC